MKLINVCCWPILLKNSVCSSLHEIIAQALQKIRIDSHERSVTPPIRTPCSTNPPWNAAFQKTIFFAKSIGFSISIKSTSNFNLAYRWFCRLGLEDKVPDHSTFSNGSPGQNSFLSLRNQFLHSPGSQLRYPDFIFRWTCNGMDPAKLAQVSTGMAIGTQHFTLQTYLVDPSRIQVPDK